MAALAARQHGVVTRAQLLAAGLTEAAVEHRVRSGRLFRLHRGVYAVGHTAVDLPGRDLAAVLACGPEALLSHQSAGARIEVTPAWRGPVHVLAPGRHQHRGVVVHQSRRLAPEDRAVRDGIPVTSAVRTLVDLADVLRPKAFERALAQADVRGLVTGEQLRELPARAHGRRGAHQLARIFSVALLTRSELEELFLAVIEPRGIPQPLVNRRVHGYEVDCHWPAARLVVELDGYAFHRTRYSFEADRERDAALLAAGWRVMRITARKLTERPGQAAKQVELALAAGA